MIDWDRLNSLRDDIGEEDFADVAFLFVAEIGENLDRLVADPSTAIGADFHFLRGSASNLGFRGLEIACRDAEAACRAGQAPDVAGVAAIFKASLTAVGPKVPELAA